MRRTLEQAMHHLPEITAGVTLILVIAIGIAFAILIPLSKNVATQAQAGDAARTRQLQVAPGGCKQNIDAYRRGIITRRDLDVYASGALAPCKLPPVKP